MKTCTKCMISKSESEFYIKDKKVNRLHAQCKACYKQYRKTHWKHHYDLYGEAYRLRANTRKINYKRDIQQKLMEYMRDKQCETCGESEMCALDFDHLKPETKRFGIASAVRYGYPWPVILAEIEKCRILCANCHRKHTAIQYGWYKTINH